MRCKNCDYPLWNIRARECPECGAPFKPSEFEFTINSVRFCCPHCGQAYYGTGAKGHLVPESFNCVSCARPITMDEAVLLPAEGVDEHVTVPESMPWLERERIGYFKAWLQTIGKSMIAPGRLMDLTPENSSVAQAFWFAILSNLAFIVVGVGPMVVAIGGLTFTAVGAAGGPGGATGAGRIAGLFGWTILWFIVAYVGFVVLMLLWALLAHGMLRITGGAAHPLSRTCHAVFYSSGANSISAIPCFGPYTFGIWWLVSASIALKHAQRVHGGRAALAVCTVPVLMTLAVVGIWVTGMVLAVNAASRAGAFPPPNPAVAPGYNDPAAAAQNVADALGAYVADHGTLPPHALAMVDGSILTPADLSLQQSPRPVTVAGMTLDRFQTLSTPQQQAIALAAGSPGEGTLLAHRLGDFVFVYHGIKPAECEPGLWFFILCDTQGTTPGQTPGPVQLVYVGLADGTVDTFDASLWPTKLGEQNALREDAGLSPLRDPCLATDANPILAK